MKTAFIAALAAALTVTTQVRAAECDASDRPQTTPTERFTLNADGTVTDKNTGLIWMSCAVGQRWDGNTCAGQAQRLSWDETDNAKNKLNENNFAGFEDWRVPMVPELASIIELQCFNPRVNVKVFPATPSDIFWTSMEKMGTTDKAYTLDFGGGEAVPTRKSAIGALRLVRGGPWWTPPAMTAK